MGKRDRDVHEESAPATQPAQPEPETKPSLEAPAAALPVETKAAALAAEPIADAAPAAEPTFPVSKLAERHGQKHSSTAGDDEPWKVDHLVASTRHGWLKYERDTGLPVTLTDADYLAALEAARGGKVHGPANKRGA